MLFGMYYEVAKYLQVIWLEGVFYVKTSTVKSTKPLYQIATYTKRSVSDWMLFMTRSDCVENVKKSVELVFAQ